MNPGQKMFLDFFMARVKEGKEEEAKKLLLQGFDLQTKGKFTRAYMEETIPQYLELIKPEAVEELKKIMVQFGMKHEVASGK